MDVSPLQTLESHRLCHSAENRQAGCQSDKDCVVQTAGKIKDWLSANRIQPARRPQCKKDPKRLDGSKLNKDSMRQDFITDICNQLDAIDLSSEDPEENCTVFNKTVYSSDATTLGHPSRKPQRLV